MCCAFFSLNKNEVEENSSTEKHIEYPLEKKLAINLIAELSNEILGVIPEKIVLVNACREISSHWQEVRLASEEAPTRKRSLVDTLLPADKAKVMFSQIWNSHFARLVNSRSGAMGIVGTGLKAMETMFINGKVKGIDFFNLMLDLEEKKSRVNEKAGQNTIARLGGVHNLVTCEIPETNEDVEMSPVHVFQIALAQQFVEYLYIQKDFAGLTPFPTNLPDSEYIKRTRNHSLNILDHLKKNGWKGIANPELVEYLDKHITLPEDLTSVSRIGTHDLNLSKDLKGKDTIIDPKITIGIDGLIGFGNFNVEIISPEGNGYIEIPFSKMMGSRQNELSRFFDDQDVLVEWTSFPKLIDINELPRTHFVVSRSKSVEDEAHHIILSHRANHGFARRHLHLVGRKIFQSTGHFRQDGQEASNDLILTTKALNASVISDVDENIVPYPSYPSTNEVDTFTRDQQELESKMGISDVTFNFNFDHAKMSQNIRVINEYMVNPSRKSVESVIASKRGQAAINSILSRANNIDVQRVISEVQDILNARINRQMLLNLVLKQGRSISTASCVFPAQSYGRVSLAITPNCSETMQVAFNKQGGPIEEDALIELKRALSLATVEQSLAYLGLPPLGFLGVYTHRSKGPAQSSAEVLTKDANSLAAIDLIVSDLKYGSGIEEFHSAHSQYDDNTFGAVGIINGRLSARLNLTKKSLLTRFLNRKLIETLGIAPTLELEKKDMFAKQFKRKIDSRDIAILGSLSANLYRFPNMTLYHLYNGIVMDYEKFLKPHGVNVDDIIPVLGRTILADTYVTIRERRDQWENLASNLATSVGHDYNTSSD